MKNNSKKCLAIFSMIGLIAGAGSFAIANNGTNNIANAQVVQVSYYYSKLNNNAKKFYNALESMESGGKFEKGESYDLLANKVVSTSQVEAYKNGDNTLLKDFGAGRDAYFLDNPQLFYIDFDKLSISFAQKGEQYLANIDAGKFSSYYTVGLSGQTDVADAKAKYETKLQQFAQELNALKTDYAKAVLANTIVCQNAQYSFDGDGSESQKAQIRTSYGVLVNGYAVCEGYARAYKMLMDSQNIPCEEIIGYIYNDDGGLEPHAWNYVKLDEKWYLVDTTNNDNDASPNKYFLLGSENAGEYVESKTISNSEYEFTYPSLASYNYGEEEITTLVSYDKSSEPFSQEVTYRYKNYKNAMAMKEDGFYLFARHERFADDNSYIGWADGYAIYPYENGTNKMSFNQHTFSTQFFVTTQEPDSNGYYRDIDESKIVAKSDVLFNEIYNEQANTPNVLEITPAPTSVLEVDKTYDVSIKYSVNLKLKDKNSQIGIFVYNEKSKNLNDYCVVENVKLENNNTISFRFTPSKMYEHDSLSYKFIPFNVVGVNDIEPKWASLTFARPWKVCSKIFNDNRLYIDSYATPTIIDSQDLSMTGFKDKDGNPVSQNQRSQLVLVASKPSDADNTLMDESAKGSLDGKEIKSSATYEIDLHICGGVTQIPNGSYMKVAFGFPEGYSAKDKGVEFKVFHFKRGEDGNIDLSKTEELKCVVTEYGIVVVVDSFSPFMVVAVENNNMTTKNVYAKTLNGGGKVESLVTAGESTFSSNEIVSLSENQSVTYQITANEGYEVDYVLLNNKAVELVEGEIMLSYEQLNSNNELKIAFVSSEVKQNEDENGIINLDKSFVQNQNIAKNNKNNSLGVYWLVISLTLLGISIFLVFKNKKKEQI